MSKGYHQKIWKVAALLIYNACAPPNYDLTPIIRFSFLFGILKFKSYLTILVDFQYSTISCVYLW